MNNIKNLLVFDTEPLLSANKKNPLQVWHTNQQLGQCFIPALVFQEIEEISNNKKSNYNHKAKDFFDFFNKKGCQYKITPKETRRHLVDQIPLNDEKDKQLVVSSLGLAYDNRDSCVILITYNTAMKGFIKKSNLNNICFLKPRELADWVYSYSIEGKKPTSVYQTHNRIKKFGKPKFPPRRPPYFPPNRSASIAGKKPKKPKLKQERQQNQLPINSTDINQLPSKPQTPKPLPLPQYINQAETVKPSDSQNNLIFGGIILLIITLIIGAFIYLRGQSNQENNSTTIPATPANILASADNSIREFRQTKNSNSLLTSIKQLERLRNEQGGKLDSEGKQKLSRLKHKYAIEVLASNSKSQAAEYLLQIPETYYDYENVEKWLKTNGYR